MKRRFDLYLKDIMLSMNRIEEYTEGLNFESFKSNYLIVDAVIRNFEVMGEACKNIPEDFKSKYPKMPWRQMYGLRNIISHEYFGIDYATIWEIIINEIPSNKSYLKEILIIEGID